MRCKVAHRHIVRGNHLNRGNVQICIVGRYFPESVIPKFIPPAMRIVIRTDIPVIVGVAYIKLTQVITAGSAFVYAIQKQVRAVIFCVEIQMPVQIRFIIRIEFFL